MLEAVMGDMAELHDWFDRDCFDEDDYFEESPTTYGFWRMANGNLIRISEMETSHLQNVVNLLVRRGVQPAMAIQLELEYRKQASNG